MVVDDQGTASPERLTGWFFRETRYLSRLECRINGEPPFLCSAAHINANRLEFTYIYPPVDVGAGGGSGSGGQSQWKGILRRGIDIQLAYEVHASYVDCSIRFNSRWDERVEFDLEYLLAADYCDMPEAQSGRREQEANVREIPCATGVAFHYEHPELPLETRIHTNQPCDYGDGALRWRVGLERQRPFELHLRIQAVDLVEPFSFEDAAQRERALQDWEERLAYVTTPGETIFGSIINRGARDLGSFSLLEGVPDEWLTPAAGVPLYLSLWGRDALTATWQCAAFDRGEMAAAALARTGRLQGRRIDPARDEEPGRIIQQARSGPLDRIGKTPFSRYYADQASPFDYIFEFVHAFACSGDRMLFDRHWDTARRIMDWARTYGDPDKDGFLEYQTRASGGPRHQGWKDSENALMWPAYRVPECVEGYGREDFGHPGAYPRANAPQMWNQSAWLLILHSLLALQPVAPLNLLAVDPLLPEWLPELTLHCLRIGSASLSLRFRRKDDGSCATEIIEKEGVLHIIHQPSPNSLRAGVLDRFAALVRAPVAV